MFLRTIIIAALLPAVTQQVRALTIYNYLGNEQKYERFESGYPSLPIPSSDEQFIGNNYDWSGVGWNSLNGNQSVTMITPYHFVGAKHYTINAGKSVTFQQNDGNLYTATVAGYDNISWDYGESTYVSDLVVGHFTEPIPVDSGIATYSILQRQSTEDYIGDPMLVYGWTGLIGENTIEGFDAVTHTSGTDDLTFASYIDYDTQPGQTQGEFGDSGSPSFIPYQGALTISGSHYAIDASASPSLTYDSFLPFYIEQMETIVERDGYQLNLIAVPEPAGLLLMGSFLLLIIALRKKRKLI